ncbi:MAG: MBL fold metallo-hydrolase [Candidatus Brockarchaeota archaeon]|nr:MBL fold metallo-hydrolase [Candidatus Brockarchaeota archaeon]
MRIEYLGHACFRLTGAGGIRVVLDPFDGRELGYPTPSVEADYVLVSHDHADHNYVDALKGNPAAIKRDYRSDDFSVKAIHVFHDEEVGAKRGRNTIFTVTMDGIVLAHLGDLGHILDEQILRSMGKVDVLFIPVGGTFTIDAAKASIVVDQVRPKVAIPMHFGTPSLPFRLQKVDAFLQGKERVRRFDSSSVEVGREDLPERTEIWVLKGPQ